MKRRKIFGDKMTKSGYSVDCAIPGGNIIIDKIDGDDVFLRQDLRDTVGNWFYWCFRVRCAENKKIIFRFADKQPPVGACGPAVSKDNGRTWSWLGKQSVIWESSGFSFEYAFGQDDKEIRFSFGMPYLEKNLHEFIELYKDNANLELQTLCKSRKERSVERLHIGRLDGKPAHRVLLTSRHHSCEMMASYTLEGIMEGILANNDDAKWLRENVEFLVIPFVDKDGVEDGDQGKNRKPHDHARDYTDKSIYPEVKTLMEFLPGWSEGRLKVVMDLHCPWMRGAPNNESIYMVGTESQENWRQQCIFAEILESVQTGSVAYSAKNNIPFGNSWNTNANYSQGVPIQKWVMGLPEVKMATALEIPYANAQGFNAEIAKIFGHALSKALHTYLKNYFLEEQEKAGVL
jgi:hypothetical protein